MTIQEKALYHQIHPLKLAADWGTMPLALSFLWRHRTVLGLTVLFVPPMVASYIVIRFFDLEGYKRSRLGRYVEQYMTPLMQALRFTGLVVMVAGAWLHRIGLVPVGLSLILFAWLRGLLFHDDS